MTQLVVVAERRGELPPTRISPRQLQHPEQPTLTELRAAFSLHRLSRALAGSFCRTATWFPSGRHDHTPEAPDRILEWMARVSLAVFRALIPLLKAKEHPDPEIRAIFSNATGENEPDFGEKELAYLMQFAVCDLEATLEAQETIFAPLAEWLLQDVLSDREAREAMAERFDKGFGRAGFCRSQEQDGEGCPVTSIDGGSNSDAHLVVWELIKMLWVVEQVRLWGAGDDGTAMNGAVITRSSARQDSSVAPQTQPAMASAVGVFFGTWRAEEVTLPACDLLDAQEKHDTVAWLLTWLFDLSGRPNHYDYHDDVTYILVAPPELKFFGYFLERYLGLCFDPRTFRHDRIDFLYRSYQEFAEAITIFSHDDVESRCSCDWSSGISGEVDFLDGSEILARYPHDVEPFYRQRH
ncbi:hypothetical protein C8A01DRAFT_39538 [Parachaetomium inaequale]|uniref:Uncharacterized protein n=1 Tax=Parachaetomium inaequale TaxID=2588326 RepID=A0AAN6P921_9PEZI|nr:hypothetical protein C8A01DRAFT_39538 [Parachaetomium inaequale]